MAFRNWKQSVLGPFGLGAVAIGLTVQLLLLFSAIDATVGDVLFGAYSPRSNLYLLTFATGLIGCFVTVVTQLLSTSSRKPTRTTGALLLIAMLWDVVAFTFLLMPASAFSLVAFYATLLVNAGLSSFFIGLLLLECRIHHRPACKIAALSLAGYLPGFILAHFDNLLPIRHAFNMTLLVRFILIASAPAVVAILKIRMESPTKQNITFGKIWSRVLNLYTLHGTQGLFTTVSVTSFVQVVSLLAISFMAASGDNPWSIIKDFNIVSPMLTLFALRIYISETKLTQENQLLARLNSDTIKRFIRRYKWRDESWATTIGIRTASYTIDHDPDEHVTQRLPATLVQIRREEIDRCVDQVIGSRLLHKQQVGNQIIGIVDSETTMSPCVEVLMLFTCIYLDATPLVERRLKALAALFPILDPDLAKFLTPHRIDESLARVQWIFHFDYDWVDQQMVTTPGFVRYGVNLTSLRSQIRFKIVEHLKKRHYLGNFIWVGDQARQQLLLEAPFLAPVIEACPLAVNSTEEDTVIFIIKFEELIPRMQRYYPLENLRIILNDYEPSTESRAFLKVAEFQIAHAKSLRDLEATLDHLLTHAWIGFKEKDMALRLVLQAYSHASELLSGSLEPIDTFRQRCFLTIETIGYPSQMLHYAEMNKRKIRSAKRVIEIINEEGHERFADTWLFLASNDMSRYSTEDLHEIIQVMTLLYQKQTMRNRAVVQLKFIPAYFNVCRHLLDRSSEAVGNYVDQCAHLLLQYPLEIAHFIYFLDAHSYLQTQVQISIALQPTTFALLQQKVQAAMGTPDGQQPLSPALQIRWRSYEKMFSKFLQAAA